MKKTHVMYALIFAIIATIFTCIVRFLVIIPKPKPQPKPEIVENVPNAIIYFTVIIFSYIIISSFVSAIITVVSIIIRNILRIINNINDYFFATSTNSCSNKFAQVDKYFSLSDINNMISAFNQEKDFMKNFTILTWKNHSSILINDGIQFFIHHDKDGNPFGISHREICSGQILQIVGSSSVKYSTNELIINLCDMPKNDIITAPNGTIFTVKDCDILSIVFHSVRNAVIDKIKASKKVM